MIALVLALAACGTEEAPVVEATPPPTPEATPEPTPEATPEVLEPILLFHVVLDEIVAPPPTPTRSPLARDQGPPPSSVPDAAFLSADGAARAVVDAMKTLEDGFGAPGQSLVLVQWRLRWGERAEAGAVRRWGLCSLPCTLEDAYVATAGHHPVDPITQPRPLFAHRPGASDVLLEQDGEDLRIRSGDKVLWEAGGSVDAIGGTEAVVVPSVRADGIAGDELSWTAARVLVALSVELGTVQPERRSEPLSSTTRLFPRIGKKPDVARLRGVESVPEVWPWPEASRFEGGFSVKPDPAAEGLRLDRAAGAIHWTPTTGQAGGGEADFGTYSLSRGQQVLTVEPFPEGAAVLGSSPGVDGEVIVASGIEFEQETRAQRVAAMLDVFADVLPPGGGSEEPIGPWLVYCVAEPVGVVRGSAGARDIAVTVSEDDSERLSVARAWAQLLLAPHVGSTSPVAADFVRWAEAQLLDEQPDRSLYMATFATAGEDVQQVWRQWLVDPIHGGAPDPAEFLAFVGEQLPDLATKLRRDLPLRRFVVEQRPEAGEFDEGSGVWSATAEQSGPAGTIVTVLLPEGASHNQVEVLVAPSRRSETVSWTAALVPERYWDEAATDAGAREALLPRFGPTLGIGEDEEEEPVTPIAPPSQIEAMRQARVVTKPRRAGPTETSLEPDGKPTGRSAVVVVLWGVGEWDAEVQVTARITIEGAGE